MPAWQRVESDLSKPNLGQKKVSQSAKKLNEFNEEQAHG
jgi:hypothetical protein